MNDRAHESALDAVPPSWLLATALLALAGCGVTADSFCASYVDALDARSYRCAGGAAHLYQPLFKRLDTCGDYQRAIAAKTALFDATKAKACLDALDKGACESTSATPIECKEAFLGAGAVGAPCHATFECGTAMTCDSVFGSPCPGQCRAMAMLGQDCSGTTLCAAGLSCDTTKSPLVCVAQAGLGEACRGSTGKECALPLFCAADGKCSALKTSGACGSEAECAPAYRCAGSPKACVARKKKGEACVDGQRECQLGLACSGGTCVEQGQLGSTCSEGNANTDGVDCLDGYCDSATHKCTAFKAPGAACTPFSFECGVALCPSSGTCPVNGGVCHVP